jgi:hypothetical protein
MWKYVSRARRDWSGFRRDRRALFANLVGALAFVVLGRWWLLPDGMMNGIAVSLLYAIVGFVVLWILEFFGLWALAPYRIELDRANALEATNADLLRQVAALTPKPRALPSLQRREDDLRQWIEKAVKGGTQAHMWLGQVVPPPYDFRDYIDPLEKWAARSQSDITIEYDDVQADGTRDIHFKARRYWWP